MSTQTENGHGLPARHCSAYFMKKTSAEIVIEKGIPVPLRNTCDFGDALRKMEVGDSFRVGGEQLAYAPSNAHNLAKRSGIKVTTRKVTEDGEKWTRIWRTA